MLPKPIVQVGVEGEPRLVEDFRKNLPLNALKNLILECDTWISCDSFLQHFAWDLGKPGIVLWSVSDPNIFGHPENINLLKCRSYLRQGQFLWWADEPYNPEAFVSPEVVLKALKAIH